MKHTIYAVVFEIAVYALFLRILWRSVREDRDKTVVLLAMVVFCTVTEIVALYQTGLYCYDCDLFLLNIPLAHLRGISGKCGDNFCLPLCIPLMESVIIYSLWATFRLSDMGIYTQALFCGLTAMLLDMALDPVVSTCIGDNCSYMPHNIVSFAIDLLTRLWIVVLNLWPGLQSSGSHSDITSTSQGLGFWIWHPKENQEQIFAVLLDNFVGWLFSVTLITTLVPWVVKNVSSVWYKRIAALSIALVVNVGILVVIVHIINLLALYTHPYASCVFSIILVGHIVQMLAAGRIQRLYPVQWDLLAVPLFIFGFTFVAALSEKIFKLDDMPYFLSFWLFMLALNGALYTLPYKLTLRPKAVLQTRDVEAIRIGAEVPQ
jgi:hypothetical protein